MKQNKPQILSVYLTDFKLTPYIDSATNELTFILNSTELGDGINSDYSGYDKLAEGREGRLYSQIYERLVEKFSHVYLMNIEPNDKVSSPVAEIPNCSVVNCYREIGFNGDTLNVEKILQWEEIKQKPNVCLVVPGKDSETCARYAMELYEYCKKNNIEATIVNGSGNMYMPAEDKWIFRDMTNSKKIKLEKTSAMPILSVGKYEEKVAIKLTNKSGGQGVFITDKIENHVNFIVDCQTNLPESAKNDITFTSSDQVGAKSYNEFVRKTAKKYNISGNLYDRSLAPWWQEESKYMLIEPFFPGVKIDNREATGRIVFSVYEDETSEEGIRVDFYDGYWKLAANENSLVSDASLEDFSRAFTNEQLATIKLLLTPQIKHWYKAANTQPSFAEYLASKQKHSNDIVRSYYAEYAKNLFHELCKEGHVENAKKLFQAYVSEKNEVNPLLGEDRGGIALSLACYFGHIDIVKLLLADPHVDINFERSNSTPFWSAIHHSRSYFVKSLSQYPDSDLYPYSLEIAENQQAIAKLIIKDPRFDKTIPDGWNRLPLDYARQEKNSELINILETTIKEHVNTADEITLSIKAEEKNLHDKPTSAPGPKKMYFCNYL